jgi:hypothetical protein
VRSAAHGVAEVHVDSERCIGSYVFVGPKLCDWNRSSGRYRQMLRSMQESRGCLSEAGHGLRATGTDGRRWSCSSRAGRLGSIDVISLEDARPKTTLRRRPLVRPLRPR